MTQFYLTTYNVGYYNRPTDVEIKGFEGRTAEEAWNSLQDYVESNNPDRHYDVVQIVPVTREALDLYDRVKEDL